MSRLSPFLDKKIVVLKENNTILEAAKTMAANDVGCILVKNNEGRITGILTDRDITCRGTAQGFPLETPIAHLVSRDPILINKDASLQEAVDAMIQYGIRRVPVVAHTHKAPQKCVGLVTLDDLIYAEALSPAIVAKILRAQFSKRKRRQIMRTRLPQVEVPVGRSEARRRQSVGRLYNMVAAQTHLPKTLAERVLRTFLDNLVMRLEPGEAAAFLSQFPSKIQDDMSELPPGPNRKIKAATIIEEVADQMDVDLSEASRVIFRVSRALELFLSAGEMENVCVKLPRDFQILILGHPSQPSLFRKSRIPAVTLEEMSL